MDPEPIIQFTSAVNSGFHVGAVLFGTVWGARVIITLIRDGGKKE
jgi:hypothetical protein